MIARREIADRYTEAFRDIEGLAVRGEREPEGRRSAWHLYPVRITGADAASIRREVYARMRAESIGVNVHYRPVYLNTSIASWDTAKGCARWRRMFTRACCRCRCGLDWTVVAGAGHRFSAKRARRTSAGVSGMVRVALIPARGRSQRIPRKNTRTVPRSPDSDARYRDTRGEWQC